MNGLIDEPGWRWPWVARLNGRVRVVAPADHRAHLAGLVVDRDDGRGRARWVGQVLVDRVLGRVLEVEVERRVDLQPALERLAGAELVDELLADPGREVRRLRSAPWAA